jgi:protoporphyrin/coproporphyrin ferrochelatase
MPTTSAAGTTDPLAAREGDDAGRIGGMTVDDDLTRYGPAPGETDAHGYDALLLVSFGGPEGPDDVIPFLENVTRGRGVPGERLEEVAVHYRQRDGVSPINGQNRALLAALREDFSRHGLHLPVYWGNRNWHPLLPDTLGRMAADGVRRALAFVTSAYSSYSGCRQYREDLAEAAARVGPQAPRVERLRHYFNHPGFVAPMVDATVDALGALPAEVRDEARLVFVTHSVPVAMDETSGPQGGAYTAQHREVAHLVSAGVGSATGRRHDWDLVFCSRSGPPAQPWLEPDVNDHLEALATKGVDAVVLVPIGFVSDHMEVVWDLDTEAMATATRLGVPAVRAATVGTDARFVAMVRDLVRERAEGRSPAGREALGALGPNHDVCPAGCCPNPRGARPALAGED